MYVANVSMIIFKEDNLVFGNQYRDIYCTALCWHADLSGITDATYIKHPIFF